MSIYQFKILNIDNQMVDFEIYKNHVLLIVNVASKCGFTKQYADLQKLYEKYQGKGLKILGFPCNQFFFQEPKDEQEIKTFCQTKYNVTFDMFAKINVNGKMQHELYQFLKEQKPWTERKKNVQWNFEKFLIDKNGNVVGRYESKTNPFDFEEDIIKLL